MQALQNTQELNLNLVGDRTFFYIDNKICGYSQKNTSGNTVYFAGFSGSINDFNTEMYNKIVKGEFGKLIAKKHIQEVDNYGKESYKLYFYEVK